MGCQNSKLNRDILAIPPKLRPLLWRKVEELRRRRSAATANGGTLSKKELLTDGVREESDAFSRDHESLHENYERNDTTSSPGHESVSSSASQPKTIITEEDKKKTSEEEIVEPEKTEINMENEGDQEAKICPSSPSFRVYFIESLDQEEEEKKDDDEPDHEDKDDSKENENDMQKEWNRENSVESVVLIDTHEDQETKIVKKKSGKSRMRFRRALCRGGPVAVKHLLNVRSCYHPSSDRASLLAKKSAP
ncbi:nuclear polyadenylated RNA-binding protein 3 [Morus notabilis]|uniref:nuclear polyadenylated RNA-binding protein 3 n=1 Tax=Morus notabilis TaxID=981085 RepID=UPI000CED704A|nr:nuclear polyadenylated RNA-binding protein 3 [Morus notabilis]